MTSPLSLAGFTIMFGTVLLLYATVQAVRNRKDPRRLILWGALHDAGIVCMAMVTQTAMGATGLWLFILFQIAARLLAWFALARLKPLPQAISPDDLTGAGQNQVWTASLFSLGMLASVGGSPFLLPEARAYIVQALLESSGTWVIACLLLMAAATTVFIWLYVDTIRRICLEEKGQSQNSSLSEERNLLLIILGVLVALLGLFRVPLTDAVGTVFSLSVEHESTNLAYIIYYVGAFVTGIAFLCKQKFASWLGALTAALALAAVLVVPEKATGQLFLVMITVIGFVVSVYSLGYIHEHKGLYWFFLLLTNKI